MTDKTMRELLKHGNPAYPIAAYEYSLSYADNFQLECHWHDEWEFFSVTDGRATFSVGGSKAVIEEGDVVFIPNGRLHMSEGTYGQPYRCRAILFNAAIANSLCNDLTQTKYILPLLEGKLHTKTYYMLSETDRKVADTFHKAFNVIMKRPPVYEMLSKAYILELLANVIAEDAAGEKSSKAAGSLYSGDSGNNIKQTVSYIHENYEKTITVELLARMVNMSSGHFAKLFKLYTSAPPIEYVIKLRLSKASELLAKTDDKISCVAINTGFNSLSYFIRIFTAHFGCTPTDYRKKHAVI